MVQVGLVFETPLLYGIFTLTYVTIHFVLTCIVRFKIHSEIIWKEARTPLVRLASRVDLPDNLTTGSYPEMIKVRRDNLERNFLTVNGYY